MPRFQPLDPERANGKASILLDAVQSKLGFVPNIMKTFAQAPAALEAYLNFSKALGTGTLDARLREQIAVAAAGVNSCGYCASAHTAAGGKLGIDSAELLENLEAKSGDPKTEAALRFTRAVIEDRGFVSDDDVRLIREAGYSDGEIIEIIANISLNLYTIYFNHIAQTVNDFPEIKIGEPQTA